MISRAAAKARGLTRYFTGKPCPQGHVTERFIANGTCAECHREKERESKRKCRQANPEKVRESKRKYRQANPHKVSAKTAKRRASKWSATPPWLTQDQLAEVQQMYDVATRLTACTGIEWHVDHIIPLKGDGVCGLHVPWNLVPVPASVNLRKSNKVPA